LVNLQGNVGFFGLAVMFWDGLSAIRESAGIDRHVVGVVLLSRF
jgi:hypothetical protein